MIFFSHSNTETCATWFKIFVSSCNRIQIEAASLKIIENLPKIEYSQYIVPSYQKSYTFHGANLSDGLP